MATRFYRRRFLNRRGHHAGAYIYANLAIEARRREGARDVIDAELTIADCSRVMTLDFAVYDRAGARNAVYKARLLRQVVNDFTDALEAAVADLHSAG